jgi:hypothetical protein
LALRAGYNSSPSAAELGEMVTKQFLEGEKNLEKGNEAVLVT